MSWKLDEYGLQKNVSCGNTVESHWQRNKIFRRFDQHDVSKGLYCGDRERERERAIVIGKTMGFSRDQFS